MSRVLNDDPHVAPLTRERVRAAIDRLHYEPNQIARGLVRSRTGLIGVVVSDITNPFYPELLEVITQRLDERGLRMILINGRNLDEDDVVRLLREQRVDGTVFTAALTGSDATRRLVEGGMPVVLVNRYVRGLACDSVRSGNLKGAQAAAVHLTELGHRRLAVIAGEPRASTSRDRLTGFKLALRTQGLSLPPELVLYANYRFDRAYDHAFHLLAGSKPPTAIFCANDWMAFAALSAAARAGVAVPHRLSIVGYDDLPMAAWGMLELTTVRQPLPEMAVAAVDLLVERIAQPDKRPRTLIFESGLVVRGTTAPPADGAQPGDG